MVINGIDVFIIDCEIFATLLMMIIILILGNLLFFLGLLDILRPILTLIIIECTTTSIFFIFTVILPYPSFPHLDLMKPEWSTN
jgi:hypothetical protein